jgi:hypothetical protein
MVAGGSLASGVTDAAISDVGSAKAGRSREPLPLHSAKSAASPSASYAAVAANRAPVIPPLNSPVLNSPPRSAAPPSGRSGPTNQSEEERKAPSADQGPQRLKVPDWTLGNPMYRSSDYASLLRPPPATAHYNVVYVSLEETTLSIGNVLRAAQAQYGSAIVAADVFPTSKKVALAFAETTEAIKAAGTGLTVGDSTLELTFYAKR